MFSIWNKISNEPVTTDGEPPASKNIRLYSSKKSAQAAIGQNDFAKSKYEIKEIKMKDFYKTDYERFADSLQCAEEILYAIEAVTGESFEHNYVADAFGLPTRRITKNAAYLLWEEGGREGEILAALPTEDVDDGEEVSWDSNSIFAEFDGEKWSYKKQMKKSLGL